MNPILLFFVQALAWFGMAYLIANPYLPPWVAISLMGAPLLISCLAWRVPSGNWNWPFAWVRHDSGKLRFRRRVGLAIAILFVFFHLVVSHLLRRAAEDGSIMPVQAQFQKDALHLSQWRCPRDS